MRNTRRRPPLAVVSATGAVDWTFDPATFPFGIEIAEAVGDDLSADQGSIALGDGDGAELDPALLATVERDGRWYVSISYTIGEYARQAADLPMPTTPLSPVGSPSPEAAADAPPVADYTRPSSLDPRVCLEFATNEQIIACAERYRPHRRRA